MKKAPIHHIDDRVHQVPVLIGAAEALVRCRELRVKYETNRDIKLWSAWFLLKSISVSSHLSHWIKQKHFILSYVQCNENTFRRMLKEMVRQKLATVDPEYNITLTGYKEAADILNIVYAGKTTIPYNPRLNEGKQNFRYLLIAKEMKHRQQDQLSALMWKLNTDKNHTLKIDIMLMLHKQGCDEGLLVTNPRYFQERLLQLQVQAFKSGSEILSYIYTHRADINRGVKCIQKHHGYRSPSSVSYLKGCMVKQGVITVTKVPGVISTGRARLYVPDAKQGRRDGYKWLRKAKTTVLFLTDQITFYDENYEYVRTPAAKKAA